MLLAAAEHTFTLERPNKQGVTQRAMLEQLARSMGKRPADLDGPAFPLQATHVWEWFLDLCSGRGQGFSGPAPLTWADLKAWADLTGNDPSPDEVRMLRGLDRVFMQVFGKREA